MASANNENVLGWFIGLCKLNWRFWSLNIGVHKFIQLRSIAWRKKEDLSLMLKPKGRLAVDLYEKTVPT